MALIVEVGMFTAATSTGSQTVTLSKFTGKTPKALILFADGAVSQAWSNGIYQCIGMAAGSNQCVCYTGNEDNVASPGFNTYSRFDQAKLLWLRNSGNPGLSQSNCSVATFTSFGTNQFTINWVTNQAIAHDIHYVAIGGDNVDAYLFNDKSPNTNGDQAFSGAGFQPKAVVSLANLVQLTSLDNVVSTCIGASDGTTDKCSCIASDATGATYYSQSKFSSTIVTLVDGMGTTQREAVVKSFDASGLTLTWSGTASSSTYFCSLLCLGGTGMSAYVGQGACKFPSTGTSQYTTDATPEGVLMFCPNNINESVSASLEFWMGAIDGTNQACIGCNDDHGVSTSNCVRWNSSNSGVLRQQLSGSTTDYEADYNAFSDTYFELNWTNAAPSAHLFGYLSLQESQITDVIVTPTAASLVTSMTAPDVLYDPIIIEPSAASLVTATSGPTVVIGTPDVVITPDPISVVLVTSGPLFDGFSLRCMPLYIGTVREVSLEI